MQGRGRAAARPRSSCRHDVRLGRGARQPRQPVAEFAQQELIRAGVLGVGAQHLAQLHRLPLLRVQHVAQAVAQQVEAQADDDDGEAGMVATHQ